MTTSRTLTVVGVDRNRPADKAGLRPGDVIVGIDDEPVVGLANMFRRVWSLGKRRGRRAAQRPPQHREDAAQRGRLGDRAGFQRKGTVQ